MFDITTIDGGQGYATREDLARGAADFYKALTAGYGTDHALLTGGAALRRESLESSIYTILQQQQHFVLFNLIAQTPATATVHEWTTQTDVGGYPGSGAVGELVDIPESTGRYDRNVILIKYLKDRRRVSVEAEVQSQYGLDSAIARETMASTLKLLTDCEYLMFYGRSDCNQAEFDGLVKILGDYGGDHVYDCRARPLSADAGEIIDSARLIWDQGQWGQANVLLCSGLVKQDLNLMLDPAHRVILGENPLSVTKGANVTKIETGYGVLDVFADVFIKESGMPFQARGGNYLGNVQAAGVVPPASVTAVASADTDPTNGFQTAHAGTYYYAAECRNANGRSVCVVAASAVTVASGQKVTVTVDLTDGVTPPNATSIVLYRGRRNGTNALTDLREIAQIPVDKTNPTADIVYVDRNQNIPGTSHAFVLTLRDDAIELKRLLPLTRFPLYPTTRAEHVWAQLLFVALMVGKVNQHRLLKNILPSKAAWRPF